MTTYVMRDGKLVDKAYAPPLIEKFGDGPMVISDFAEPVFNHADGQRYSSRRAYERAVQRASCVVVGNEVKALTDAHKRRPKLNTREQKQKRRETIRRAIRQHKN